MAEHLDMQKMQEEATRRAREMQRRSRVQTSEQEAGLPPAPPPPAEAPANVPDLESPLPDTVPPSVLESLFKDQDQTLILILLLLIGSGEEHGQELTLALLYLLM